MPGVDGPLPDEVDQVRQEAADRGGAAVQVDVGEEELLAGQLDPVGDADETDVPAGRVERTACIIDSWVAQASPGTGGCRSWRRWLVAGASASREVTWLARARISASACRA